VQQGPRLAHRSDPLLTSLSKACKSLLDWLSRAQTLPFPEVKSLEPPPLLASVALQGEWGFARFRAAVVRQPSAPVLTSGQGQEGFAWQGGVCPSGEGAYAVFTSGPSGPDPPKAEARKGADGEEDDGLKDEGTKEFCVCRHWESGTMVFCEDCQDWYVDAFKVPCHVAGSAGSARVVDYRAHLRIHLPLNPSSHRGQYGVHSQAQR
jgi:hypothetical protein